MYDVASAGRDGCDAGTPAVAEESWDKDAFNDSDGVAARGTR
jgi:hypothetical protein